MQQTDSRKTDRRQAILRATLDLIAVGGVDSVTHRRVAKQAGIALGSTTYYFESREHLIRAAFDDYLDQHRLLREQINIDPAQDLNAAVDFLIAYTLREFEQRELLITEYEMTLFAARDVTLADALNDWYDRMTQQIAQILKGHGKQQADELARTTLHLLRGYQLERLTRPSDNTEQLRQRLHTLFNAYP